MFSSLTSAFSTSDSSDNDSVVESRANVLPPLQLKELFERFQKPLAEVRELIADELKKEGNQMYDDDIWILRFLFNPKYSSKQCAERYLKMIQTRKADGVNEIRLKLLERMESLKPGEKLDITTFPHFETVNKAFPESLFHTLDQWGQPVALQLLGRSDPKLIVSGLTKDDFYVYALWKAEYMRLTLDKMSKESGNLLQWVQVIDLAGLGMSHINRTAMDVVKTASNRVDQMYKECLGKILVVNAPRVFHMIWAMMKLWVSERTAQKVTLLGAQFKEDLASFIPPENWPFFLGGQQRTGTVAFIKFDETFSDDL